MGGRRNLVLLRGKKAFGDATASFAAIEATAMIESCSMTIFYLKDDIFCILSLTILTETMIKFLVRLMGHGKRNV